MYVCVYNEYIHIIKQTYRLEIGLFNI
jgi:hypothetical protein